MPAIMILIIVGMLIGTWMAGGTIPMLIYYGLKLIDPAYLALISLVVTAIVSLCTDTSWGSAGTIGVAFMGVAIGSGANLPMVAGAVVAGAYFGDKLSPLSDTTNIASLAAGVNLFTPIRHLLWTTVPAFLVSAAVYLIAGMSNHTVGKIPEKVYTILDNLDQAFSWNFLLLIPVLIVLIGSMMKYPTIPVMLVSSAFAVFNACVFQHVRFVDAIGSAVNGFNVSMVASPSFNAETAIKDVTTLLNRGGMNSMMSTLLICFCAITFAGVVSVSGSLDVLITWALKGVKSTFSLIATTIATAFATIAITSNGQVSILIPAEMLRFAYVERGLDPKNLSRTVEDAATVIEPILPWTVPALIWPVP